MPHLREKLLGRWVESKPCFEGKFDLHSTIFDRRIVDPPWIFSFGRKGIEVRSDFKACAAHPAMDKLRHLQGRHLRPVEQKIFDNSDALFDDGVGTVWRIGKQGIQNRRQN